MFNDVIQSNDLKKKKATQTEIAFSGRWNRRFTTKENQL